MRWNLEQPMKKNTGVGGGHLSGTWSQALLIRAPPCVEEVEVSYLASSRTVFCFILRIFVLLIFSCFSVFFFTLYLNVWQGIGLLYLVRRQLNFCGTLINCLSVRGSGWEEVKGGDERRLGTFAPKTHRPCSTAHVNSLLRARKRRSESWGLVPDTCTEDSMRYGGTSLSRHSPSVILTFLSSSSPLRLPGSPTFFFNKFFRKKKLA